MYESIIADDSAFLFYIIRNLFDKKQKIKKRCNISLERGA